MINATRLSPKLEEISQRLIKAGIPCHPSFDNGIRVDLPDRDDVINCFIKINAYSLDDGKYRVAVTTTVVERFDTPGEVVDIIVSDYYQN